MLWSRLSALSFVIGVVSVPVFGATSAELNQRLCEGLLGVTLQSKDPLVFDRMAGLGLRGFLGAYPESTSTEAADLAAQGIMYWGHSFAVRKTVEEAKIHDAKFSGLFKIMYLISDVDVSDLTNDSSAEVIRERYKQIIANGKLVYWDDSEAIVKKQAIAPKFVEVNMAMAGRLIDPDTVGFFNPDERGPRFNQSGWAFPKIRGELKYAVIFESGSGTIAKILKDARKLAAKGYTFTFNQNFEEALNAARDQIRLEKNENSGRVEKVAANSRYRSDDVYNKALEGYRKGTSFSVEVRDGSGKLVAGVLGERHGNIVALETIFYGYEDKSDGSFKSNLDEAKMAVLAALKRLHEHGIDVVDAGMVSKFTASLKGEYVAAEQFAGDVEKLHRLGNVNIDFSRPWEPE